MKDRYKIEIGITESPDHRLLRISPPLSNEAINEIHRIHKPKKTRAAERIASTRITDSYTLPSPQGVAPSRNGVRGIAYIAQVTDGSRRFTEIDIWANKGRGANEVAEKFADKIAELELLKKQGVEIVPTIQDFTDNTPGRLIKTEEEVTLSPCHQV